MRLLQSGHKKPRRRALETAVRVKAEREAQTKAVDEQQQRLQDAARRAKQKKKKLAKLIELA